MSSSRAKHKKSRPEAFPFTAMVGQEEMKLALILNVIDPSIGGVLVMGHRGTGKSTIVRALAEVLPSIERVQDDPYNRSADEFLAAERPRVGRRLMKAEEVDTESFPVPVVDLPLGATEDRVCGTIDIEQALTHGVKSFEPGLLAQANRGFLYIDEVNLLDDHLVDVLLDVAASGRNVVEREGISVRHPARFVLVGSGNPEEGELRPQLLDRFGLSVEVTSPKEIETRIEVIRRRDAYENDHAGFMADWEPQDAELRARILAAREALPELRTSNVALHDCASVCLALGSDGLRGELTLLRAARALAAFEGASELQRDHIRRAAPMALRHRLRRDPLDEAGSTARVARQLAEVLP